MKLNKVQIRLMTTVSASKEFQNNMRGIARMTPMTFIVTSTRYGAEMRQSKNSF